MDRIRIIGGERLQGTIQISGAKNAALPLMIASLLTRETLTLKNVPRLADVTLLSRILGNHGVDITVVGKKAGQTTIDGQTFKLKAVEIVDTTAPYEMISRMRASFWVLAPLLARCGEAKVSLPGGCVIGTRPVDLHLTTLESLGASIELEGGYVIAKAPKGLTGARIALSKVSVGATHNALMAAVLARGDTVIENAAREPEVADLASCLRKVRARIGGIGTSTLQVQGAERLHGAEHRVLPDRIETGTYAMAAAMTDGDVMLEGARADLLQEVLQTLRSTGIEIEERASGLRVAWNGGALNPRRNKALPRLSYRPASSACCSHEQGKRPLQSAGDCFRESLHACSGTRATRCPHRSQGRYRLCHGGERAAWRASHGDGFARLGLADHRGTRRPRRDADRPHLSSRSRLRANRGEARPMRRAHRAGLCLAGTQPQ